MITTEVGVTATRRGLTSHQEANIYRWLLTDKSIRKLHHGMCVGGDEQIHDMATELGFWTIGHPPVDDRYLANCVVDEEREPKEYLARDRDIVDESSTLLVAPFQDHEPALYIGSGTWYTYGYGKSQKIRVVMFWPSLPFEIRAFDLEGQDGETTREGQHSA